MTSLPLFPLNTVLFPGAPLDLHIFEERYKRMIQRCLQGDQTFGVCLIQQGLEAHGPLAEPHIIGCAANIVKYATLADGRMLLQAIGTTRFRILRLETEDAYWVGEVEPFPLQRINNPELAHATERFQPMVSAYLEQLSEMGGKDLDPIRLPTDPVALAHVASILLQIPQDEKQTLLAEEDALELILRLDQLYRRELPLLRLMANRNSTSNQPYLFSSN